MIELLYRGFRRLRWGISSKRKMEHPTTGIIPKQLIQRYLPEGPVVIEAGAHIGVDTTEMSILWPNGVIYAFEPIPEIFGRLKANTRKMKNVHCFPLALSDTTGTLKMFVSSGTSDGSSSLLAPKEHLVEHPDVLFQTTTQVQSTTLDDWIAVYRVARVDFLWLDVQGAELSVLKASPRILRSVRAIYTEVSLKEVYEGVPLYPELRGWLEEQGFRVERQELPWPDMGNVLFVRKDK